MIEFFVKYHGTLLNAFKEHTQIVGGALFFSILLASVLTISILPFFRISNVVTQIFNVLYTIPSLALFAILIPFMGLGVKTAIFVLVFYNQYLLLRSNLDGLNDIDSSMIEAAKGMGMNYWQVLYKVRIPLALPRMIGGIRLAAISTIGIATIAATINAGGLGKLLFDGLRTMNTYKILWGAILSALLALVTDGILRLIENKICIERI